jgi:DNA-binding IclR family transcriptional regulator
VKTPAKSSPLNRYVLMLEAIAAAQGPLGLSELAAVCRLPLGSAHRLLASLLSAGLVVAEGSTRKTYQVGPRLLRLLHTGTELDKVRLAVHRTLEQLAKRLGETCYLARLTGVEVISVAWAVPDRGIRGYVFPGDTMPPNAAASAKAIIAFQPREVMDRILGQKLEKFTPATKTSARDIRAEYTEVHRSRFATCWDELEVGLGAIACPVELPGLGVIYAVGTAGTGERLQRQGVDAIVSKLQAALPELERVLKHVSSADFDQPPRWARDNGGNREVEARLALRSNGRRPRA